MGELYHVHFAQDYPSKRRQNWDLNPGSFMIFSTLPWNYIWSFVVWCIISWMVYGCTKLLFSITTNSRGNIEQANEASFYVNHQGNRPFASSCKRNDID